MNFTKEEKAVIIDALKAYHWAAGGELVAEITTIITKIEEAK